jgi:Cu+-exporting ATPase
MKTTIIAPDIECDGCAASIQKALGRQDGVQTVAVDVPTKTIMVDFDPAATNPQQIADTLTDIGFPPSEA